MSAFAESLLLHLQLYGVIVLCGVGDMLLLRVGIWSAIVGHAHQHNVLCRSDNNVVYLRGCFGSTSPRSALFSENILQFSWFPIAPVIVAPHKYRDRCHPVPLQTIFKVCAKNFVVHLEGCFGVFYQLRGCFGLLRALYEEMNRRTGSWFIKVINSVAHGTILHPQ